MVVNGKAFLSLLVVLFVGSVGCAILAGLDGDRRLASGTGGSSSVSASSSASGSGGASCVPVHIPGPPMIQDAGGSLDFTVALRTIDLGESSVTMGKVGLDRDGVCTCPGPPSCAEPTWAYASHCDGLGGRDNAAAQSFSLVNADLGPVISSPQFSYEANKGAWSLLLRVRGYNGGADDDQVEAAFFMTPGLTSLPKWDGTDAWPVGDGSLADKMSLDQPLFVDPKAYVSGGVLVASLSKLSVLIQSAGVRLQLDLSDVALRATILQPDSGAGFHLTNGVLGASWILTDMFTDMGGLRLNGVAICTDSLSYATAKSRLCGTVDLGPSGSDAGAPCNALSFGMSFAADPAILGPVAALPAPSPGCSPMKDPSNDVCGP